MHERRATLRRWAVRVAIGAGLAVVAVTLSGSLVKHLVYPIPAVAVGPPPAGYEEVFWRLDDGVTVHGWHGGQASPGSPVVLFFHGNGENLETLKWSGIFERWRELGVQAVAVDYPGYGRSGGRPSEASLVAGALAAFDWTAERFPDRRKIVAGWSLGAAVAMQVAAARPEQLDGLVVMSAWTRLVDVGTAHFPAFLVRLLLPEGFDSLAAAESVRCPVLALHGGRDTIIPTEQGRRLATSLGARARWVEVERAGHNDLLGEPQVWRELLAFIDRMQP